MGKNKRTEYEANYTYVEPAEYFIPEMLKVAEEWERKHEAEEIAKKHRPEVDTCTEREDAYIFSCSTDKIQDGGKSPVVVMKEDRRVLSLPAYVALTSSIPTDFDQPV